MAIVIKYLDNNSHKPDQVTRAASLCPLRALLLSLTQTIPFLSCNFPSQATNFFKHIDKGIPSSTVF